MQGCAFRLSRHGGALLAIDYGYSGPAAGDTLQAVKAHRFADPFAQPGEADLTAHVDFAALAFAARNAGALVAGPDRKSVVSGKSVLVRVELGGRRIIKQKK